jgi:hypothetical protein
MALIVDVAKQYSPTFSDIKDMYLRFDWIRVYPKYQILRFGVNGYLNKESGQTMRNAEYEQVKAVDAVFGTTAIFAQGDVMLVSHTENREAFINPQSSPMEPKFVWIDIYSMKLDDLKLENLSVEYLYPKLYELLKHDTRFSNIRDEV